ncbi:MULTISPECIES: hypothetical protein [Clavibacter]|uniref:Uncharacterized protein n=2 Tax=Clavibacter TaxID=1573 RepID=A0A399NUT3_9MICO|nr:MULTISPECIES: hypothetical protein [Clavibacter]KDP92364.1 hypothetical protein W824_02020 [Clavibacter cf. michiganensis LMG 26808]RII97049.1 hypothetical protein DZF96_08960 [Clavibacter michiganensis]UKF24514.1 hypothetical protein KYT88_12400 [Clavibacter sp. A6099]
MRAPLLDPSAGGSRPRTPRLAFAGDAIPALADLRAAFDGRDEEDPRPVRALVVGVDAQAGGIRGVHAVARCLRAVRVPDHLPELRHLVVVVGGRVGAIRPDLRALDAWVVRTHAGLERTRGADVAVTGILASGCVTPRLLTNRVVDLVRHPIAAPRIAVEWADIRDRRIRDVALEAWC